MQKKRTTAVVFSGIAALAVAMGCSDITDAQSALCCKDFQPGADMLAVQWSADATANGQFGAVAQAIGDLSVVASGSLTDVTEACRGLATDLGYVATAGDGSANATGTAGAKFWCDLAVKQLAAVKGELAAKGVASADLAPQFTPPKCEASFSAKANCEGKCDVNAKCDIKANPPTCEGGKLEVACKGECTGKAGASVSCEGSCSAECKGECTVKGGIRCAGKCEGTCKAGAEAGETGIQADGTCKGSCEGTCSVTPPGVACTGSCKGECSGSCKGTAEVSVKCDGECKADYEPLKCSGGELKGGCTASADCSASCSASASGKAECTPPSLTFKIAAQADLAVQAKIEAYIGALEANLPKILVVAEARGKAFATNLDALRTSATGAAKFSGSLKTDKVACLPNLGTAMASAVGNFGAALEASGSVVLAVK